MSLFDPENYRPDARKVATAELRALADSFHRFAAGSANLAVQLTYTRCAECVEDRIAALERGDQFHV